MKYTLVIELQAEAVPGNPCHMEALLQNPSNKIKIHSVEKHD